MFYFNFIILKDLNYYLCIENILNNFVNVYIYRDKFEYFGCKYFY